MMEKVSNFVDGKQLRTAATGESAVEEFIDLELSSKHERRSHEHRVAGPLPLIIGVTGHRDLRAEDHVRLRATLRSEFEQLRELYPSTPFVLLSALAEGADRIAAHVAIEMGLRLVVVLPMPLKLYEKDFDSGSLEEFHSLLTAAERSLELPFMDGLTPEDVETRGLAREKQYAQLGAYLASHSTVLFALWDGVHLNKVGGTSQIVRFKLEGIPSPFARVHSALDAPDRGPVYHIVTPRRSNPDPIGEAFVVNKIYPPDYASKEEAELAFRDIYERMEMLNHDAVRYSNDLREHLRESENYLFPQDVRGFLTKPLQEIRAFYAIADVLSQRFQRRTFGVLRVLLTFVWFAAVFYELYSGLLPETSMIALYLGMFVCAYASYKWADWRGYQARYLDYRALAEGLRIQFFWKLAGIEESVADYYLRKQKSELEWIRNAVRSSMTETSPDQNPNRIPPSADQLRLVLKHWVEDQAKYFLKAAHRDHEKLHKSERIVTALFSTALVIAVIQLALGTPSNALILCIAVLPVGAALIHHYLEKNALAEHKRQYTRMSIFYNRAKSHLTELIEAGNLQDAQSFLAELGREALVENGDWILTHRDRPLEVPKGG